MEMREYSTIYLDIHARKGTAFHCYSAFHSHSMVFNNKQNHSHDMSVN